MILKLWVPVVGSLVAVARTQCPEFCPADYDPVCGDDGKLYSNRCTLQVKSCNCNYCVLMVPECKNSCGSGASRNLKCSIYQDKTCTFSTCGNFNGVSRNERHFVDSAVTSSVSNLSNNYGKGLPDLPPFFDSFPDLDVSFESLASSPEAQEKEGVPGLMAQIQQTELRQSSNGDSQVINHGPCNFDCFNEHDPVCGSDRVLYDNLCKFEEAKCQNQGLLSKAKLGVCQLAEESGDSMVSPPTENCELVCPMEYQPVCGKDGETYSNSCFFDVAVCLSGGVLKMQSEGPCTEQDDDQTRFMPSHSSPQNILGGACSKERNYVCASDGQTYANMCLFNTIASRTHITVVKYGMCDEDNSFQVANAPADTPKIDEVIASSRDPEVLPVLQLPEQSIETPNCPNTYSPICGTDGVTYPNICILRLRSQRINLQIGIKQVGECPIISD